MTLGQPIDQSVDVSRMFSCAAEFDARPLHWMDLTHRCTICQSICLSIVRGTIVKIMEFAKINLRLLPPISKKSEKNRTSSSAAYVIFAYVSGIPVSGKHSRSSGRPSSIGSISFDWLRVIKPLSNGVHFVFVLLIVGCLLPVFVAHLFVLLAKPFAHSCR